MKKMDKEEGMNKEEVKLHHWKIPLLEKSHHRRGRFLPKNLQQVRRHALVSPS
jgi:hypothetical protein